MTQMRGPVLHVLDHSFPINDGYAFRTGEILKFLRRNGWKTAQVTSAKQGVSVCDVETVCDLPFFRTPTSGIFYKLPLVGQLSVVTSLRRRLFGLVRAERPQVIHAHSPCLTGLAALPVARRFNIPLVYEVRALWEDGAVDSGACSEGDLRYRATRALETYLCRRVDAVVPICEGLRSELSSRGLDPGRLKVVPNSIDCERFFPSETRDAVVARKLGLTEGKTFGFIGTFFPYEGLEVLLRAVPLLRAAEPQARFLIVGDGPDGCRIRQLARELAVEDVVIFTGRVPHSEVTQYYDAIDVFIYPRVSKRVTELVTPLKPLEAMAKKKLIVASDVGGHREMVFPERNGMLFRAGDPASLAKKCTELLNQRERWNDLRENGWNYIRDFRCWQTNISLYDSLYREMVAAAHKE